jgi:hypothetical protein
MTMLRKHILDAFLIGLSAVCAALMIISSSDPVLPSLKGTTAHQFLRQFTTGNQIIFDLSVGILAGVFMFFLVVRVPEYTKRRRLRANLSSTYEAFKQECIVVYLGCVMSSYPAGLPRELSERKRFREFFKEQHTHDQTKWDAVANGLNEHRLKTLIVELEVLMHEIQFTLGSADVQDQGAFRFFKKLSQVLYRSKNWTTDYDDVKAMLGFLWSVHTGWSWMDGYPETDPVADMIAAI